MLRSPTTLYRHVSNGTRGMFSSPAIRSSSNVLAGRCRLAALKQQQSRVMAFSRQQSRGVNYYINPLGLKMPPPPKPETMELLKKIGKVLLGGCIIGQIALGYAEDFFDYRFVVKADPTDLQDFFGTEAAMEVYSIFPFVTSFLMRRGAWDDEGVYRVPIILGDYLSARIDFDERERERVIPPKPEVEKEGEDEDEEEEEETGPICEYFVKKERFRFIESHIGRALCDYSIEMGFNLLPNGEECEIFFRGTKFNGLFPFRIVFQLQGLIFLWGMKQYFRSNFFAEEELSEQAEHYRLFVPLAVIKEYLYDLKVDVQESLDMARAKNQATAEHEKNIDEIKGLLAKAGYIGADAVLVNVGEDGKQKIMLNLKDKQARAIIQRALTFNKETAGRAAAGVNLARKMTMRISEAQQKAAAAESSA